MVEVNKPNVIGELFPSIKPLELFSEDKKPNVIEELFPSVKPLELFSKDQFPNLIKTSTQSVEDAVPTKEDEVPSHLMDAVTQEMIVLDPHTLKCGHSYNKLTLAASLRSSTTCPQCRAEIGEKDFKANETLAKEIQDYVNSRNPFNRSYYDKEKADVEANYGHLQNERVHPGEAIRHRGDYQDMDYHDSDYPSLSTTSLSSSIRSYIRPRSQTSNNHQVRSNTYSLRDLLNYPIDQMAYIFFDPVSELTPDEPGSRTAEFYNIVRRGTYTPSRHSSNGTLRFKKYFASLFGTKEIPADLRARTMYYSGFSGGLKKLSHSIVHLSNSVFNSYHRLMYFPKSIYGNIKTAAQNGYLYTAERLVTSELRKEDVNWTDKGYSRIAKEHIAKEITDANLKQVYRLGEKIKDTKIRDKLFVKVAKVCARKKEYLKATKAVSKISAFFNKIFSFGFVGVIALFNSIHTMVDLALLPFKYLVNTFIKD